MLYPIELWVLPEIPEDVFATFRHPSLLERKFSLQGHTVTSALNEMQEPRLTPS